MLGLKTNKKTLNWAVVLGLIFVGIYHLPLNAQSDTTEYNFLTDIEAGENTNWSFSSEDETISLKDEIRKLGDYTISTPYVDRDIELFQEDKRWGNRGDAEDRAIEAEIYDY